MKKNVIIWCLVIVAAIATESAIFFGYNCNRNYNRLRKVSMYLSEVREENEVLKDRIANYEEVLDSIDNPHHHDYLTTIGGYQKLRPTIMYGLQVMK